jgi:hypothetical protein
VRAKANPTQATSHQCLAKHTIYLLLSAFSEFISNARLTIRKHPDVMVLYFLPPIHKRIWRKLRAQGPGLGFRAFLANETPDPIAHTANFIAVRSIASPEIG